MTSSEKGRLAREQAGRGLGHGKDVLRFKIRFAVEIPLATG